MIIRRATEADAGAIVTLVRQGFEPHMLDKMTYGYPGMDRFLSLCISTPHHLADTNYTVADVDGRVVGSCELRPLGSTLFWNYHCTAPEMRHSGVGKKLLYQSILLTGFSSCERISLDVFDSNTMPIAWYERLGFRREFGGGWWSFPLPAETGAAEAGTVSGMSQAMVCHQEFGFSHFTLNTAAGSYSVGRLGTEWFRVSQASLLSDGQALETLKKLDPKRRIVGIFTEKDAGKVGAVSGVEPFCRTSRMTADLPYLMEKLAV
jgi:ribosomal protein S18 acetylase RimI-like enzyme